MEEILVLGRNKLGETSPDIACNSNVIGIPCGRDFYLLFLIQWLEAAVTSCIPV